MGLTLRGALIAMSGVTFGASLGALGITLQLEQYILFGGAMSLAAITAILQQTLP